MAPSAPGQRRSEDGPRGDADPARRELLDAVLDTVEVGIVACDAAGHLTLFNTAARRFHGLDHDPTVDAGLWPQRFDLYDADHTARLRLSEVPLYRALVDGRVSGAQITIAPPGSPPRLVRCDGQQLRAADGAVTGAVVAMSDVTELRRAAEALTRQSDLAASLAAAAREAHLSTDERGTITSWNAAAQRLLGVRADDALGTDLVALAPASLSPAYRERLRTFLRGGEQHTEPTDGPLTLTHADGHDLLLQMTAWLQPTGAGWELHAFLRLDRA